MADALQATQVGSSRGTWGADCDPATRVTKSLLGYGVIAGPFSIAVWLIQAFTRTRFDLRRHPASLLSDGHLGWIQVVNFLLTGAMVIAGAIGMQRALPPGRRSRWIAGLVALFGVGMIGAAMFKADPSYGFPPGTAAGKALTTTLHGNLHLVFGTLGFLGLIVATFVMASYFVALDDHRHASLSVASGVVFLLADLSGVVLANDHETAYNLTLTAGIIVGFAWLTTVSVYLYRLAASRSSWLQQERV
jgi:Protein of unknown function (DUF998)